MSAPAPLSASEAARVLGLTSARVSQLRQVGRLAVVARTRGGRWLFCPLAVEAERVRRAAAMVRATLPL